jgi:hypothetical protein
VTCKKTWAFGLDSGFIGHLPLIIAISVALPPIHTITVYSL